MPNKRPVNLTGRLFVWDEQYGNGLGIKLHSRVDRVQYRGTVVQHHRE